MRLKTNLHDKDEVTNYAKASIDGVDLTMEPVDLRAHDFSDRVRKALDVQQRISTRGWSRQLTRAKHTQTMRPVSELAASVIRKWKTSRWTGDAVACQGSKSRARRTKDAHQQDCRGRQGCAEGKHTKTSH